MQPDVVRFFRGHVQSVPRCWTADHNARIVWDAAGDRRYTVAAKGSRTVARFAVSAVRDFPGRACRPGSRHLVTKSHGAASRRMPSVAMAAAVALLGLGSLGAAAEPADGARASSVVCSGTSVNHPALVARQAYRLRPCWSALAGDNFEPLVVAGHLIVGMWQECAGLRSGLVALDVATGKRVWHATRFGPGGLGRLGAGSGVLVLSKGVSSTVGIDLRTGVVKWTVRRMSPFADGPTVAVLLTKDGRGVQFIVVARKTGRELWRRRVSDFEAIGVSLHAVLFSDVRGTTTAYDARTGARRWAATFGPAGDTAAVRITRGVATGVTGFGRHADDTRAYRVLTGRLLWTSRATPLRGTEPANHSFYVSFPNGRLAALAARTGRVRWRVSPDATGANPVYAGPGLVLIAQRGVYRGLSPMTGRTRWRVPIAAAGVFADGNPGQLIDVLPHRKRVFFAVGNCIGDLGR